jgi:hypothetical protein
MLAPMGDQAGHVACVDAWLERSARQLPPELLLRLFEAGLGALWARTKTTLGDVTLTAIADRVLYNAAERFPDLASLKVDPEGGIQFRGLREHLESTRDPALTAGIRFVLVELLTVLGNLTAEVLTPELHAELSHVALPDTVRTGEEDVIERMRVNTEDKANRS